MPTLIHYSPARPINPLLPRVNDAKTTIARLWVRVEKRVRAAVRSGALGGISIQDGAASLGISVCALETIEAGMRGEPRIPDDSLKLYEMGRRIGEEVR